MKKSKHKEINPHLSRDNGFKTIQAITATGQRYTIFQVKFDDGDDVGVSGEVAEGLMLIHSSLNPTNKARMERMSLLELLHIYTEALKDGVLKPSRIKGYADAFPKRRQ